MSHKTFAIAICFEGGPHASEIAYVNIPHEDFLKFENVYPDTLKKLNENPPVAVAGDKRCKAVTLDIAVTETAKDGKKHRRAKPFVCPSITWHDLPRSTAEAIYQAFQEALKPFEQYLEDGCAS